ncbi:MAG TPA: hypothetical protein VF271_03490, partial [Rhodanobacteraceae bacterium]
SIAAIVWILAFGGPGWLLAPILGANLFIAMANLGNVHRQTETLGACLRLCALGNQLASLGPGRNALPELAALVEGASDRRRFARALWSFRWVTGGGVDNVPVVAEVASAVKSLLLVEVLACGVGMRRFARVRSLLVDTFEHVGALDAGVAVASWMQCQRVTCRPRLDAGTALELAQARHPLLPDGVANDVAPGAASLLVTGSNMAGKTTFIKMVGLNVILGRTLGVCAAERAVLPCGAVMAAIRGEHSVTSGKSRYFAEIEAIQAFLARAAQGEACLFLIDEPFSGTNTAERIAIARAVLEALGRNARVLVTTHDVELQSLLGDAFALCHFQENPDVDGFFDYHLHLGAARERNAIALLERVGFPPLIVEQAARYAEAGAAIVDMD